MHAREGEKSARNVDVDVGMDVRTVWFKSAHRSHRSLALRGNRALGPSRKGKAAHLLLCAIAEVREDGVKLQRRQALGLLDRCHLGCYVSDCAQVRRSWRVGHGGSWASA
jgi:hypothetical protein